MSALVSAVLGSQFGDEGKGKFIHALSEHVDICCRFNGGSNAGHTISLPSGVDLKLHQIPCGIVWPHVDNLLGHGMVIHLQRLFQEIQDTSKHVSNVENRIWISNRAHLLLNIHVLADKASEQCNSPSGQIGTTKQGIGPAYLSKACRYNVRVADIYDWERFTLKYKKLCTLLQGAFNFPYDPQKELDELQTLVEWFKPRIVDGIPWLHENIAIKKRIMIEGANATSLDLDVGTYPFVTSSTTTVGGIGIGLGIPPAMIGTLHGVVKAYTTRVGNGPFVTELFDQDGAGLQRLGKEFGATTGRPRRCGWLDLVLVKYSTVVNGFNKIILTKIDVLTGFKHLKICVAYQDKTTKKQLKPLHLPASSEEFKQIEPVYKPMEGWSEDLSKCKLFEDFPRAAKDYILFVESYLECPIELIGTGKKAEEYVLKRS